MLGWGPSQCPNPAASGAAALCKGLLVTKSYACACVHASNLAYACVHASNLVSQKGMMCMMRTTVL